MLLLFDMPLSWKTRMVKAANIGQETSFHVIMNFCAAMVREPRFQIMPVAILVRLKLMPWLQGEDVATIKRKLMRSSMFLCMPSNFTDSKVNIYSPFFLSFFLFFFLNDSLLFLNPGDYLDFALFTSDPPYNDVIFQDATQKLQIVPPSQRHYHKYLGPEFLRARQLVDCQAGAVSLKSGFLVTLAIFAIVFSHIRL